MGNLTQVLDVLVFVFIAAGIAYVIYSQTKGKKEKDEPKGPIVVEPRNPPVDDWEYYLVRYPDVYAVKRYRSPDGAREHFDKYGKAQGRSWGKLVVPDGVPFSSIGGGSIWKPVDHSGNNLVILFPASWATPSEVTVNGEVGRLATSENHPDGRTNGNRPTFRFSKPGRAYGKNVQVVVDGKQYFVPDGGQRIG